MAAEHFEKLVPKGPFFCFFWVGDIFSWFLVKIFRYFQLVFLRDPRGDVWNKQDGWGIFGLAYYSDMSACFKFCRIPSRAVASPKCTSLLYILWWAEVTNRFRWYRLFVGHDLYMFKLVHRFPNCFTSTLVVFTSLKKASCFSSLSENGWSCLTVRCLLSTSGVAHLLSLQALSSEIRKMATLLGPWLSLSPTIRVEKPWRWIVVLGGSPRNRFQIKVQKRSNKRSQDVTNMDTLFVKLQRVSRQILKRSALTFCSQRWRDVSTPHPTSLMPPCVNKLWP